MVAVCNSLLTGPSTASSCRLVDLHIVVYTRGNRNNISTLHECASLTTVQRALTQLHTMFLFRIHIPETSQLLSAARNTGTGRFFKKNRLGIGRYRASARNNKKYYRLKRISSFPIQKLSTFLCRHDRLL